MISSQLLEFVFSHKDGLEDLKKLKQLAGDRCMGLQGLQN